MTMDDPKTTKDLLLESIGSHSGITREELIAEIGLPSGTLDPARIRLWEVGKIEPDNASGWDDALANRVKTVRWTVVDDPVRQADVRDRARARKRRNAKPSAEQRACEIVDALKDSTVNRLVKEMTKDGVGSRRAQQQAAKILRAQHMERNRQAKAAEREKATNAEFKRLLAHLWDARGAVGAIDAHLIQERARVANCDPRKISDSDWAVALRDVRMIIGSFGQMWQNVRDLGGKHEPCPACGSPQVDEDLHLGAFVIDAEVEDLTEADVVNIEETVVPEVVSS
jgi:hypothetical protein